jgi:uncharacterized coiled-coil protein SlyX
VAEKHSSDAEEIVAELKAFVARERAEGRYAEADELAAIALQLPSEDDSSMLAHGFDLGGSAPRIRFRPELGFSSKPLVGHLITGVKKLNVRLLFYVFDDLARQADAAVVRLEAALAAEAAAREALSDALDAEADARRAARNELRALSDRIAALEEQAKRS